MALVKFAISPILFVILCQLLTYSLDSIIAQPGCTMSVHPHVEISPSRIPLEWETLIATWTSGSKLNA